MPVMIVIVGNRDDDLCSNLDEAVCISQSFNILEKNMILTILLPTKGKY